MVELNQNVVRTGAIVVLVLPIIILAWIYQMTRSFQATLQAAERNQRICGSNVFERETLRHIAMKAADVDNGTFGISLMVFAIVTASICLYAGEFLILFVILGAKMERTPLIVFGVAALVFGGLCYLLAYDMHLNFGAKANRNLPELDAYREALKAVTDILEGVRKLNQKNGTWETYRMILAKRIARENNLPSIEEAVTKVDTMLRDDRDALIEYMEFDLERDYQTLKSLVPLAKSALRDPAYQALDKLASIASFDPMPTYQSRFDRIYLVLGTLMVAITFMGITFLRYYTSVGVIGVTFFVVVMGFLIYVKAV